MNVFVLPNTKEDILKKVVTRLFWGTIDFHSRKKNTMKVNGAPELLCFPHSSEYLPLCSAEQRHSCRFGTTWGWVNDDRIFIFGWTIPLRPKVILLAEIIFVGFLFCASLEILHYCLLFWTIKVHLLLTHAPLSCASFSALVVFLIPATLFLRLANWWRVT